jgi:glyoxylase-like metal-dependent hydrolase (beta-lactamase superfamily II)
VSEPRAVAQHLEEVAPGLFHWRVFNDSIGAPSSSQAVRGPGGFVLVDPVRLVDSELERLDPVEAIVLTAATHQRAAWRYRERFDVPVYLPEGSRETDEAPDEHYGDGAKLPGGLAAVHAPGPENEHYALLLEENGGVLFCPDQLVHRESGELIFVPGEFQEDPAESRRTVERFLELPFSMLCLSHGAPIADDPKGAMQELLSRTAG